MSEKDENVASEQQENASVKDFVSKKAYEEVTADMHKYKSTLKAEKARAAEYEAKLKALEEERMRENEQWKELADKYKSELNEERERVMTVKEQFTRNTKKQALKEELGLSNDKYLIHADIDSIEVNEHGVIDKDSLLQVANAFREEHSILLHKPSGSNPTSAPAASAQPKQHDLSSMTTAEKQEYLRSLKLNKS